MVVQRLAKAILSFRLRLHYGLRQRGGVFDAAFMAQLKLALPDGGCLWATGVVLDTPPTRNDETVAGGAPGVCDAVVFIGLRPRLVYRRAYGA